MTLLRALIGLFLAPFVLIFDGTLSDQDAGATGGGYE